MKYVHVLMIGMLLVLAGCSHPQALYDDPPRSPLEEGRIAEKRHNYAEAHDQYSRITDFAVQHMTLNRLSSAWDDVNANILSAQEKVSQQPDSAEAHLRLARHYYEKGLLCTRYTRESLGNYPRDFIRGEQEYYYNTALEHARQAIRLDPNLPEAHLAIGEMYLANHMYSKALQELKKTIVRHPEYARGYYAVGKVYFDQKRYDISERYFIRAIKLDASLYEAYYLLGQFFLEKEMHDYAAHTFLEILRHKPEDGVAFDMLVESCHALAQFHIEEQRYAEAINLLQEVLKVKSDYGVHQTFLLAQAKLQEAEHIKEQQAAMEEMTAQESGTDVKEFIGLLFADQPLETLVPTFDAKDDTEFAEVLQHIQAQDFQQASDILEASPEKNRTDAYRLLTLALTQKQLDRQEEARDTLRTLTETSTFDSREQLWAWLALRSLGEQLDANVMYRTLGVIIQVQIPEKNGVEVLAIYLDGRVRHVDVNGQILVWDRTEGDISTSATNVVYTAQAVARDFPSEQRRDPLKEDSIRISLLTAGGVRVLEDDARRVRQQTSIMSPIFLAGTELLEKLLAIYNAT